jgi:hypothetical protein
MDEELRRLERLAASGDPDVVARLESLRQRIAPVPKPMTPTEEALSYYFGDQRLKPDATLEFRWGLSYTLNTFHFMNSTLTYNEALDDQFREWVEENELEERHHLANMEQFVEEVFPEAGGIYGEGKPMTVNTYNHETALNDILQFVYWEDDDGGHALIQVHRGGDARGNYSGPTAFDTNEHSELAFFDVSRGVIYCSNEECGDTIEWGTDPGTGMRRTSLEATQWHTDDAYRWYSDVGGNAPNLDQLEIVNLDPEDNDDMPPDFDPTTYREEDEIIIAIADDKAYCPVCRTGFLMPATYH